MKWEKERNKKVSEYILIFHLTALTLVVMALFGIFKVPFIYNKVMDNYLAINVIIFSSFALCGIAYTRRDNLSSMTLKENPGISGLIVTFIVFALTVSIVVFAELNGRSLKILYLIPVIYASVNHGKKYGIIYCCFCSVAIFAWNLLYDSWEGPSKTFEVDLILTMIIFMTAWLVGGFIDIERVTLKKLEELANKDELTGLWNKRYFYHVLNKAFDKAEEQKKELSLIIADIDNFKIYNDTLGHIKGDEVLKIAGEIIKKVIPKEVTAARYGGEEFAIILPGYNSQQALEVAEKIRKNIESYSFDGKEYLPGKKLTLSIGIATYPFHAKTLKELIVRTDDALFSAKSVTKNRSKIYYSVFDEICASFKFSDRDLANMLKTLLSVIHAKDRYTRGHSERVTEYTRIFGQYLNLPKKEQEILEIGAFLHDIGKIEIQREILNKTSPLKDEEYIYTIRQHPIWGAEIIEQVAVLSDCSPVVLYHHENFDGSGYPYGLKGNQIPYSARILRIIDSFDAMMSNRPYRNALSYEECLKELQLGAGTFYDPELIEAFMNVVDSIYYLHRGEATKDIDVEAS